MGRRRYWIYAFMTALGASMVFLPKKANTNIQKEFFRICRGVMIAASIWSLLIPAIEEASEGLARLDPCRRMV